MSRTYRPTDLEWLSSIPAEWEVTEIGRDVWVRARLGWKGLTADEYVDDGVPMLATPDIKGPEIRYEQANKITHERYVESPEIMLQGGDVLLTKDGSTIGTVNVVRVLPGPATVNGSIAVLTPTGEIDGRYLFWFIASSYAQSIFGRLRGGMGVPHLFQRDINRIRMPRPPLREQRAIADYLDCETDRIDTLIAEQRRLVELLRERRASEIAAGFAGPATTPLRHAIEYAQTGPFGTQLTADEYVEGGVPVINPTHIRRGLIVPDDSTTVTPEKAEDLARYRLAAGDIILGRKGEVDKSALVDRQTEGYVCGSDAMALRTTSGTVPDYLWWFLQSPEAHSQLELWSVGTTVSGLNQTTIRKVRLPLPTEQKQREIASHLYDITEKIDTLIAETERFIELARERRSALITAAVTGQVDVREMV